MGPKERQKGEKVIFSLPLHLHAGDIQTLKQNCGFNSNRKSIK
jgi:hypothetical protein